MFRPSSRFWKAVKMPVVEAGAADRKSHQAYLEMPDMSITERILIGAFIFGIIGLFTVIGVLTPGVGWFLYFFLIPFWAMFPMIVVGTTGALICWAPISLGFRWPNCF